jgi:hypothetical protein
MKPPIFVLGSGRSGSTLIQRILNSYSDITIWGEHGGFLKETAQAFFRILENRGNNEFIFSDSHVTGTDRWDQALERKNKLDQWQAWLNFFSRQDVYTFFRRHVEAFFCHPAMGDDHTWGFKEIRYGNEDRVVEFLSCLYPDACFVFLSRNGLNTLASQEKAFARRSGLGTLFPLRGFRKECSVWSAQNKALWNWHVSGRIRSFWLAYEDFSANVETLAPLLTSLDREIGPAQEEVLEMEEGRGSAFASKDKDRWKALGFLQLCWADLTMGNVNESLGYISPRRVAWLGPLRRGFARVLGRRIQTNASSRTSLIAQSPELAVARAE